MILITLWGMLGGPVSWANPPDQDALLRLVATSWNSPIQVTDEPWDPGTHTDTAFVRAWKGREVLLDFLFGDYAIPDPLIVRSVRTGQVVLTTGGRFLHHAVGAAGPETLLVADFPLHLDSNSRDAGFELDLTVVPRLPPGVAEGVPVARLREPTGIRDRPAITISQPEASVPEGYFGPWGSIGLAVHISAIGSVDSVLVVHGLGPAADSAAVQAARTWRFWGARKNGRRTSSVRLMRAVFSDPESSGGVQGEARR
ncbi:MAG: hypothetical protein ABI960_02950 [Candidatus Eisenbacteria bacterium]